MKKQLACNTGKQLAFSVAKITLLSMAASSVVSAFVFAMTTSAPDEFWMHLPYVLKISLLVTISVTPLISLAFLRQRRQLAIAHDELLHAIRFDSLTELLSRRAFFDDVERMLNNQQTAAQPNAIAYLDLDHFKQINDKFGHATGDEVLRVLGQVVGENLGSECIAGRLGGEEFGIFMPDCSLKTALVKAEYLVDEFRRRAKFVGNKKVGCSMSIGVAVSAGVNDLDQLLIEADKNLYLAKQNGRDCVAGKTPLDVAA